MQTVAENRTGKWNTVSSIHRIWSNDEIPVTVLHTAGLEKNHSWHFLIPLCPPPTVIMLLPTILQQTCFKCSPRPKQKGSDEGSLSPLLDSFSSISINGHSQGVCANLLHMVAKMISWLTHKESLKLSGVLYIIWRGGKRGGGPEVQSSQTKC